MDLPYEIWNEIIKLSGNYHGILVCKLWYGITYKNLVICDKCKKVVEMYGKELWVTDGYKYMFTAGPHEIICHTFRGSLRDYILANWESSKIMYRFAESLGIIK